MTGPERVESLKLLWDVLIPGNADWPSASSALAHRGFATVRLAETDRKWMLARSASLAVLPDDQRTAAVQLLERSEPERFRRVLCAVYEAYYSSPAAHAVVLELAGRSPCESSASFDETLLQQVIATRAGQRRL